MANLKIFCVIVGETKSFSVKVPSDDTVDDLKDAIKAKKSNYFDLMKIDADQLTLWRVSLPDDDDLPTLLKSLNDKQKLSDFLSDKEKLKATTKLSNIFDAELPEDTIHIIVQLPQSVVAAGKQKLSEAFPNGTCPFGPYPFGSCCCCEKQINL
ncbi:MAG: CRN family protein [Benniella sp.]|nr:MAG: CRN family protein [Benniella sp.]